MTPHQFLLFAICMFISPAFQRLNFILNQKSFCRLTLRNYTGLQIHHGHWGFAWICVAGILLAFGIHNAWTIGLLGFGLGLALDEIIPALKMPSVGRDKELEVYATSTKPTFLLLCIVLTVSFALFLKFKHS